MLIGLAIGATMAAVLAPGYGAFGVAGASAVSKIFILLALVWVGFIAVKPQLEAVAGLSEISLSTPK